MRNCYSIACFTRLRKLKLGELYGFAGWQNPLAVIRILIGGLDFFDLQSIKLDWRVAAEHADHDFESAFG